MALTAGYVYLVVCDTGLVGAFVDDQQQATECAESRAGVIVELPVAEDHRPVPLAGPGNGA